METAPNTVDWKYRDGNVMVIQYIDGVTTEGLPEDLLVYLYRQTRDDRILGSLFPGDGPMTLAKFVARLSDRPVLLCLVHNEIPAVDQPDWEIAGYAWLEQIQGEEGARKATLAYCFFRRFLGSREIRAVARLGLKFLFEEAKVDALFGISLSTNHLTHRFSEDVGFTHVSTIPMWLSRDGKLADATLYFLSKAQFHDQEAEKWAAAEGPTKKHSAT